MVIGDITYTNNEAEDDNIFCMTSVFVKAVLTQRNGTLNHPHAPDAYAQWHAQTHLNTHARTKRFHFTFSRLMSYKVHNHKRWGGDTGSFCKAGICLACQSLHKHTQRREIKTGVGNMVTSVTQKKHYIVWRELCSPPSSFHLRLPFLSFSRQPKWLWQLTGLWPFHSTILSFVFPFRVMWFYTVEVEALAHPGAGDQWAEHMGQHAPTESSSYIAAYSYG